MNRARSIPALLCALALLPLGRIASGEQIVAVTDQADLVLVVKSERKLYLMKAGHILRAIDVALGLFPKGPKRRAGDFRTPEGNYRLEGRNANSDYFLSIQVSYPSDADRAQARKSRVDPGGLIMIHGWPNEPHYELGHYDGDWTDGCIGVRNADMVDIWLMTRESTPIEIRP
jgi:murein L,D-transpeptidase YafK